MQIWPVGFAMQAPATSAARLAGVEDGALLSGAGSFSPSRSAGAAALVFVRSDRAAGRIEALDVDRARRMPGVLCVLTAAGMAAAGIGGIGAARTPDTVEPPRLPPVPPLAGDRVRHVGEAVAAIVAEGPGAAEAAAQAVTLRLAATPVAADLAGARTAPPVWEDAAGNRVFLHETGDAAAVARAFAAPPHVVRQRLAISRVHALPMGSRAALGLWDAAAGRYTLHAGTQSPHRLRDGLATALGDGGMAP